MSGLFFFKVYKRRFKSSWDLFTRTVLGLFFGTLLSITFVYVSRARWGAFPTGIFIISFFISLLLIFKLNQYVLKTKKRIKKKVVIIGEGDTDDIVIKKADIEKKNLNQIKELIEYKDTDEIIICDKLQDDRDLNLLIYLVQKLKIDVVFSPMYYMELLSDRINGDTPLTFLGTFIGEKRDIEEFFMRSLDILGSLAILLVSAPVTIFIPLLIKMTSLGPVIYRQERIGKDGKVFTLYKFRTMIKNAEKTVGPVLASRDDPRVTKVGKLLRTTRLDELPQLFNVLRGDMSLVGPRPERPHFVKLHKALRQIRLTVKPGLTGLAQIRSFYDLHPRHKIKYDYLYIQRRSLLLNLYILAKTIPVILLKKGQ
jgi:lipopolysaccharide/colanic/teichoic acid biosynthesis glycosyltransferase